MIFTKLFNKLFGAPKKKAIKPVHKYQDCIYFDRFAKVIRNVGQNK